VNFVKEKRKITNKEYQELFAVSRETASRDLAELSEMGILENSGSKGAGSFFKLK
jgi:ATP-dependent DNA helicase RecG